MSPLEAALADAARDLTACGVRFALVGGLAVSTRVEPRFTRDADLAVAVDDDRHAEAVVRAMLARGYRVIAQVEHEDAGRLATARLVRRRSPDEQDTLVDLLFASSGIEREIADAAEDLEVFPGLILPVATRAHLVALKVLAHDAQARPQDRVDALRLLADAAPEDIDAARQALALVTSRGYARGKDLASELGGMLG